MSDFIQRVFSYWSALVQAKPSWAVEMAAQLRIVVTGEDRRVVDLLIGTPPFPEQRCEIRLAESELVMLLEAGHNLQVSFLEGRIHVCGDVEQALLFSELIERARGQHMSTGL